MHQQKRDESEPKIENEEPKKGVAMRYIVTKTAKPIAGAVAGAVGVTFFSGHPEIWHLPHDQRNLPTKPVEVAALSTTAASGKMDVIYSIPPTMLSST